MRGYIHSRRESFRWPEGSATDLVKMMIKIGLPSPQTQLLPQINHQIAADEIFGSSINNNTGICHRKKMMGVSKDWTGLLDWTALD